LVAGGRVVTAPLLVDQYGSTVKLRGARQVGVAPMRTLWKPGGTPRLALYAVGRYYDGWLAPTGAIYVWPTASGGAVEGLLSMTLEAPSAGKIVFEGPHGHRFALRLQTGERHTVRLRACGFGPWYATFHSTVRGFLGLRAVSVRSTTP